MKKLYFLAAVLFVMGSVKAQNPDDIIVIPDPILKTRLVQSNTDYSVAKNNHGAYIKIDLNNDSEIQISEALLVYELYFYDSTVTDFTGIQHFTNLKKFNCAYTQLSNLDLTGLNNLEYLDCKYTGISVLDLSGKPNLKEVQCQNNTISTLMLADSNDLQILRCENNQLTTLSISPLANIVELECANNSLTFVDLSGSVDLELFDGQSNQFTSFNFSGFDKLVELYLRNNNLQAINLEGCTSIQQLDLGYNPLPSLDVSGCSSLYYLVCKNTNIQTLDLTGLFEVIAVEAQDAALESVSLQDCNLVYLWIQGNHLTTIDVSHMDELQILNVTNNDLHSLLAKNVSNGWVIFDNNVNLQYICVDDSKIYEYQELVDTAIPPFNFDVEINTYCTFNPAGVLYTVLGNVKFDGNQNGCDSNDMSIPNLKFYNNHTGTWKGFTSNQFGDYSISIDGGLSLVFPIPNNSIIYPFLENPTFFNVSPPSVSITFPETISPFTQNFCITPNGIHPDLEVVIVPVTPAQPGLDANYKLIIKNKGNIQQSGSVSFAYNDAVLDYVSANPVFTSQATGSLTWDFATLKPFETREISITLNVNASAETPAVNANNVMTYTATITTDQIDDLPLDNNFTLSQLVENSVAPNNKVCLEGASISQDRIGEYVHYIIRFENTGNAVAKNIVVKDILDTWKFDVNSMVPLSSSHSYETRTSLYSKVEFIFENINLPFDDVNNDGYVVFKIKTLPTLVSGDSFSNTASIYFDYNHPIITDPAVTTFAELGYEDFVFNNYFTLYPNPTSGILNITAKQVVEMQSISIYNTLGQMVVSVPNAKGLSTVDVSSLPVGNYFIKVVSDKGSSNAKFIKQ